MKTNVLDMTEAVRQYFGGRGLGAKLLWDRVTPEMDSLGPENVLYFGIGPITGFDLPPLIGPPFKLELPGF